MTVEFSELVQRLYDRYAPLDATAANLASALDNEPWVALAGLLKLGQQRGDLTSEEAQAGLREARAGAFERLSDHMAAELQQYLNRHTAA